MNKRPFEKYAELKDTMKALTIVVKDQEQQVINLLKVEGVTNFSIEAGAFTIVKYPSYRYSASVRKAEAALKAAQAIERISGKAKVVGESEGVRFMPSKK